VLHGDVGRLQAELVGDDLRQRGGGSLAVRRRAGDEQRPSGRIDPEDRALVRSEAREQHVAREPDAQEPAVRSPGPLGGLLAPSLRVTGEGERSVERPRVVPAVVDDRNLGGAGADVPGELVAPDEVSPADGGGVEPELARQIVHGPLGGEDGFRLAGAAIRRRRRFRGERHAHVAGVVLEPVGTGQASGRDRGTEDPEAARVGAEVGEHLGPHAEDRAVAARGELDLVPLLARVRGVEQMLAAGLDPLDGSAEPSGQQRQ
jgi:hypothetical protein